MRKQIEVQQVYIIVGVIDELMEQHAEIPVSTALKFIKMKEEAKPIINYINERLNTVFPGFMDNPSITEEEMVVYEQIMKSKVDFDTQGLTEEELLNITNVKIDLGVFEKFVKCSVL